MGIFFIQVRNNEAKCNQHRLMVKTQADMKSHVPAIRSFFGLRESESYHPDHVDGSSHQCRATNGFEKAGSLEELPAECMYDISGSK